MNYAIVLRLLSYILYCEAALLLLPAMASLIYGEWMVLGVFLLTAALFCGWRALCSAASSRKSQIFYMREGFATTALCWLLISVVGAVPFVLTGSIPNPVDAMFETVSGFTTTGASILPDCGGPAQGHPVLAQLHPLDRRHGRSGVPAGPAAPDRRLPCQPHESRKPRPPGGQAGAQGAVHGQDPLRHLFWPDCHRVRAPVVRRDAGV